MKDIFLNLKQILPGILLVVLVSIFSFFLSSYIVFGTVAIAIVLGILLNNIFPVSDKFNAGISYCEKNVLSVAIILMGAQLNYSILSTLNFQTVLIVLGLIFVAILSSFILGKIFKISTPLSILLGVGNGICGSSAIAGVSSIIDAKNEDVVLSISVINLLGAFGIFLVPSLIHYFNIVSEYQQSVIIGGTIQAVGQVTAAGYIIGDEVGKLATIIKMVRILTLGPILVCLSLFFMSHSKNEGIGKSFSIPSFIIGFIVVSLISNFGLIPINFIPYINDLSKYLLLLAMAAIGMKVSLSTLFNKGYKVILISSITFLIQIFICIYLVT